MAGSIDAAIQMAYMGGRDTSEGERRAMELSRAGVTPSHEAKPRVDLSDPAERERISPVALQAFFQIAEQWRIREVDACRLLGGVSKSAYRALGKGKSRTLSAEMIRRISHLIGIFEGLNIQFGEKLAHEWMQLPNTNVLFGGATPLDYLMKGDLSSFANVKKHLQAPRGGH